MTDIRRFTEPKDRTYPAIRMWCPHYEPLTCLSPVATSLAMCRKQEKEIERLRAVLDRTQDTLEYTKRKERK